MLGIIVDIVGIAGFVLSLAHVLYYLINNRKKLVFNFGDYDLQNYNYNKKHLLIIHFRIDNLSQKQISITRIQLSVNNKLYDSEPRKYLAEHQEYSAGERIYYEIFVDSDIVPINLSPLASKAGYFAFVIPRDSLSNSEKSLTFRICTNRGRAIQKTFSLHEDEKCH